MVEEFIAQYGYLAVFVGTFFEGETILILGSLAANRGYLAVPYVIFAGFAGSLLGDQLWFYLARRYGRGLLERRPTWKRRTDRALALLNRYNTLFILSFRFLYGLRTVSSFAVGLTNVGSLRYLFLNTIGAAVWALALGAAGFLIGEALQHVLTRVEHYEREVFIGIAAAAALFWIFTNLRERARAKRRTLSTESTPATPRNVD